MPPLLNSAAQRVQSALKESGFFCQVIELPATTRTALEAANAIGCCLGQIAKSLVFKTMNSDKPLLVVASGANRVNEDRLAGLVSEPVHKADADFVKVSTGFVIGGVPPLGHKTPLQTFIDEYLFQYKDIWAAAGHPHAVFKLSPQDLVKMTNGTVVDVK